MGFFNNFPYTNFHEMNQDWLIKAINSLRVYIENYTAINTVSYAGVWDITMQYPKWSIVTTENSTYLALQPVPVGIDVTNKDYWQLLADLDPRIAGIVTQIGTLNTQVGTLNTQVGALNTQMTDIDGRVDTLENAINNIPKAISQYHQYGLFFTSDVDVAIRLYEVDGVNFYPIFKTNMNGRDPSAIISGDNYYVAVTGSNDTTDFRIYKGNDLRNMALSDVNVNAPATTGAGRGQVWAPSLCPTGENSGYYFISVQSGVQTDIAGNSNPRFVQYYGTYTIDNGNITFSNCSLFQFSQHDPDHNNYIDGELLYTDYGTYFFTVKNEYTKYVEVYKGNSLSGLSYYASSPIPESEGANIHISGGYLCAYIDKYGASTSPACYYYYNFDTGTVEVLKSAISLRHGCVFNSTKTFNYEKSPVKDVSRATLFPIDNYEYGAYNWYGPSQNVCKNVIFSIRGTPPHTIRIQALTDNIFYFDARAALGDFTIRCNNGQTFTFTNSEETNERVFYIVPTRLANSNVYEYSISYIPGIVST